MMLSKKGREKRLLSSVLSCRTLIRHLLPTLRLGDFAARSKNERIKCGMKLFLDNHLNFSE